MVTQGLRNELVALALVWQQDYGVAPSITSTISEYDAAIELLKMPPEDYSSYMQNVTAVQRGVDFVFENKRYQIKANRPSGKPGSKVTLVGKANNYEWDYLIWILYDTQYRIQEAWQWNVADYRQRFDSVGRIHPNHMREGTRLR